MDEFRFNCLVNNISVMLSIFPEKRIGQTGKTFRAWCVFPTISKQWHCFHLTSKPLRKQAYSNILENLPAKYEKFQIKILIFFLCLLKNIDCGYSLEPPRRCFEQKYEN